MGDVVECLGDLGGEGLSKPLRDMRGRGSTEHSGG